MRKLILAAGVAAMAIAAPAAARPDKGGHTQVQRGGKSQAKAQRSGGQRQARTQRSGGQRQAQVRRGGGERHAQVQRGGGHQRVASIQRQRGGGQHAERRGGGKQRVASIQRQRGGNSHQAERRGGNARFASLQTHGRGHDKAQRVQRVENRGHGNRDVRVANHGNRDVRIQNRNHGNGKREMRVANRDNRDFRVENRGHGNRDFRIDNRGNERLAFDNRGRGNQKIRIVNRGFGDREDFHGRWNDREFRVADRVFAERVLGPRYFDTRNYYRARNTVYYVNRGLPAAYYGGCPAGLMWDSWSCVPPYYAQTQFIGQVLPTMYSSNYFPRSLQSIYADTPDYYYRYGDGYVYRVNRGNNLISALLPLIGAGLGVGMPFPYTGQNYYVPSYYQSFYPSYASYGGGDYYRYANGYVYEIDGGTGYIEDVIPLLDRGYGVGQMLPTSYSYYNVPYQYRSLYYDNNDYYYRYAPGAIYQVDRDSQLITSVASLLTGGLSVGQPLPSAYSVYNVPYQYRTTYFDTPDAWYRYNNGYIYQVDPTTQLITAIVRSIV